MATMGDPDTFASDEEQLRMLKQLAASLEKSIPAASHPMRPLVNVPIPRQMPPPREVVANTSTKIDLRATLPPRRSASTSSDTQEADGGPKGFGQILTEEETIYDRLYNLSKRAPGAQRKPEKTEKPRTIKRNTLWDIHVNEKRRDLYMDAECRRRAQQEREAEQAKHEEGLRNQRKAAPGTAVLARQRRVKDLKDVFARHATPTACRSLPEDVQALGKMSYIGMTAALIDLGVVTDRSTPEDERMADRAWTAMYEQQPPEASNAVYIHFTEFAAVILKMLNVPSVATASRSRSATPKATRAASASAASRGASRDRAPRRAAPAPPTDAGGSPARTDPAADADAYIHLDSATRQNVLSRQLSSPAAARARRAPAGDGGKSVCTFNPEINENSKRLIRSHSGTPRYLALSTNDVNREQRLAQVREDVQAEEMKECTFAPDVSSRNTARYASCARRRSSSEQPRSRRGSSLDRRRTQERQEDGALKECTFEPKVNTYKRVKDQPLPNGYFESIKRLREGRYDHKTFEDKLRESDAGATAAKRSSSVGRATHPKPFKFGVSIKNARKPLMYLDIQLPKGKKGRVGIHEGDTAEGLARAFSNSYHLDKQLEGKLTKVLAHHIDTVVPQLLAKRRAAQRDRQEEAREIQGAFAGSAATIERLAQGEGHSLPPRPTRQAHFDDTHASTAHAAQAPALAWGGGEGGAGDDADDAARAGSAHEDAEAEEVWDRSARDYAHAAVGNDLKVADAVAAAGEESPAEGGGSPYAPGAHEEDDLLRLVNEQDAIEPHGHGGDLSLEGIEALFSEIKQMEERYGITPQ